MASVSVVIPVYNVETFLARCIDSVLGQTFADLEIILVDDGSKDSSGAICDAYAEKDSRITVIHQNNGGLSCARNTGLERVTSPLVFFLDSDDYLEASAIQTLYDLYETYHAQIVIGGIRDYYENHTSSSTSSSETQLFSTRDALESLFSRNGCPGSACGKLFLRETIGTHRFPVGRTYEDAFFLPGVFLDAERIVFTEEQLYFYWHRQNSITTVPYSEKALDVIDAYKAASETVLPVYPELSEVLQFRVFWAHFVVLDRMLVTPGFRKIPQYHEITSFLQKNWWNIIKNPCFRFSRKIAAVFLRIGVPLYRVSSLLWNHARKPF